MIAVEVQNYLARARDFLKGMDLLQDDLAEYGYSPALLGIHGAISYCDALRTGMGSTEVASDDHRNAVNDLRSLLASRRYDSLQGVDRLGKLVSRKSRIAYGGTAPTESEIRRVLVDAKRFAEWAEVAGRKMKIEGW